MSADRWTDFPDDTAPRVQACGLCHGRGSFVNATQGMLTTGLTVPCWACGRTGWQWVAWYGLPRRFPNRLALGAGEDGQSERTDALTPAPGARY